MADNDITGEQIQALANGRIKEVDLDQLELDIQDAPDMDAPSTDAKPRARSGFRIAPPKVNKSKTVPKTRPGELTKPLMAFYGMVGMGIGAYDPTCGAAIVANGEACAVALDELARQNDAVRRVILAMTHTTAWGAVIAAHAPIMVVIANHHVPEVGGYFNPADYDNVTTLYPEDDSAE